MKRTVITPEQLTALRHEIARLLGDGWSHKPDPDHSWTNTMIVGPQGAAITVGRASEDGKVVIGGWSENYSNTSTFSRDDMPTIRVAYERGAAIIHKELPGDSCPTSGKRLRRRISTSPSETYIAATPAKHLTPSLPRLPCAATSHATNATKTAGA